MNTRPTTNQRLVTLLLILLIILVVLLVIGIVAGFFMMGGWMRGGMNPMMSGYNNAYLVVKETSTGNGAFELLVDPGSQVAYPEYGPNMMWNLKYGCLNMEQMMGGNNSMMGGGMMGNCNGNNATPPNVSAAMTVNTEQAIQFAQKYLDANIPGATAATDPSKFYGYYTLDFKKDGKVAGMLSVNGYSGQVFLHTWHGTFLEESEIE